MKFGADWLDKYPLPTGWAWATVGELGRKGEQPVLTGPFGSNLKNTFLPSGTPVLTIGCLTDSGLDISKAMHVSEETAQGLERYRLHAGDFLFSRMASVGRAGLVPPALSGALFNYHIMRLRLATEHYDPLLFLTWVKGSPVVREYLERVNHGATRDGINTDQLLALPLAVPPVDEQRRIMAKLDALFARSRVAKASLERVSELLERLRQSVLAAAFRGDLTADWRSQQIARDSIARGVSEAGDARINDLPPGWRWTSLDQVAEIASGLTKNSAKRELAPRKVPLVSVAAVHLRKIRPDAIASIGLLPEDGDRGKLRRDDLLLVEGNGSLAHIGRVALWDESVPEARHQNHLIRLRPSQMSPRYLLEWLASPRGRDAIIREATSAAGLYTLSLAKVGRLPVPVAPPDERREIVARVSAALDQVQSLERLIEHTRVRCAMLESAALMKACRGELVHQDPSDEPASVLLERIRAEREASQPVRSKRGKRSSAPAQARLFKEDP